jgi:hypothetical protein
MSWWIFRFDRSCSIEKMCRMPQEEGDKKINLDTLRWPSRSHAEIDMLRTIDLCPLAGRQQQIELE